LSPGTSATRITRWKKQAQEQEQKHRKSEKRIGTTTYDMCMTYMTFNNNNNNNNIQQQQQQQNIHDRLENKKENNTMRLIF
jgi:hypothetical protein